MATIDNVKHMFEFTGGANDAARRNTLIADGPLNVAAGHYFAVVMQRSANAAGAVRVTYREAEFILGEVFDIAADILDSDQGWVLRVPIRCSQLLADADAAGALDWNARYDSIEIFQEDFTKRVRQEVPPNLRVLDTAGVIVETPGDMPDDWWAMVTGRALVRQDKNAAALWQFRACMAYALCKRDRDNEEYPVLLDMLGRGAVKSYDDCTNGGVAAHVAALIRESRFPPGLHVFFSAAESTSEIGAFEHAGNPLRSAI